MSPKNNPLTNYIRTSYQELSRVVWPSRQQAFNHTIMVIVGSIAVAIFIGVVDFIFALGLEKLIIRF